MTLKTMTTLAAILIATWLGTSPRVEAQAITSLTNCQFNIPPGRWISPSIAFSLSKDGKTAQVSDFVSLAFSGKPAAAQVARNNDKRLVMSWKVKGTKDRRGNVSAAMVYRAVYRKSSKAMTVTASPLGFSETFSRSGKCTDVPASQLRRLQRDILRAGAGQS